MNKAQTPLFSKKRDFFLVWAVKSFRRAVLQTHLFKKEESKIVFTFY
jgi:hypothetical protein